MLTVLSAAIEARLRELGLFRVVERSVNKRALQSPPSAVFYLLADRGNVDQPSVKRTLTWEIALVGSALEQGQGQAGMDTVIDAVRQAFTNWQAVTTGGCLPASVPEIVLAGLENTLLVYAVRVTMEVIPAAIDK